MNGSRLAALLSMLAAVACGPAETLPPHKDAGPPTSDAGETCAGECLPSPELEWDGPMLVWMGAEADAPQCPAVAPAQTFTGYGYPDVPVTCGNCECSPPSGWCVLPLPLTLTAAAASCADNGPGVAHTSFDPSFKWDGTCNGDNAIPAAKDCGGVPCVQSVTIAPLTINQDGCLPKALPPVNPPPLTIFARGCYDGLLPHLCSAQLARCVPTAPGPEFKQCILLSGYARPQDVPCSPDYPNRSFFYPKSTPHCAPCACEPPTSTCTSSISLFQDDMCGAPVLQTIEIGAEGPTCADVPPGSALGSKLASPPIYEQGSCHASGGAPLGQVVCCRP